MAYTDNTRLRLITVRTGTEYDRFAYELECGDDDWMVTELTRRK